MRAGQRAHDFGGNRHFEGEAVRNDTLANINALKGNCSMKLQVTDYGEEGYRSKDVETQEQQRRRNRIGSVDWKGQGIRAFPRIHDLDLYPTSPQCSSVLIIAGCSRPVLRVQTLRMVYAASGLMRRSASCYWVVSLHRLVLQLVLMFFIGARVSCMHVVLHVAVGYVDLAFPISLAER